MVISQADRDELLAHARESVPNECCGYARARKGRVEEAFRAENVLETSQRYGYKLDSASLFRTHQLEDDGFEVVVYHSHPESPAEPSQTDINLATMWPDPVYLICSIADPDEPQLRGWEIRDGKVQEVELVVE